MKSIIKYALLLSIAFTSVACDADSDQVQDPNRTEHVSYATMRGNWMLTQINGEDVPEASFLYMTLSRKEELQWFEIYDNMNSSFAFKMEGVYILTHNILEDKTTVFGHYENQLGEVWNSSYEVSSLTETTMEWIKEDTKEVHTYTKVSEIPEEVLTGKKSI